MPTAETRHARRVARASRPRRGIPSQPENAIYPRWKAAIMRGLPNSSLDVDDEINGPMVALLDDGYVYNPEHEVFSDLRLWVIERARLPTPRVTDDGTFWAGPVEFDARPEEAKRVAIVRPSALSEDHWRLVAMLTCSLRGEWRDGEGNVDATGSRRGKPPGWIPGCHITWSPAGIFSI